MAKVSGKRQFGDLVLAGFVTKLATTIRCFDRDFSRLLYVAFTTSFVPFKREASLLLTVRLGPRWVLLLSVLCSNSFCLRKGYRGDAWRRVRLSPSVRCSSNASFLPSFLKSLLDPFGPSFH